MHNNRKNGEECPTCACNTTILDAPIIWRNKQVIVIIASSILFFAGLTLKFIILKLPSLTEFFFVTTFLISGYNIAKEAFSALIFRKKLSIDFLIIVAAVGSFFIGHGEEGSAVTFLFYIARFLEAYSSERVKKSIAALLKLAPNIARVRKNGEEVKIPVDSINLNDIVVVKPGEKIPTDGVVVNGNSSVNQTSITGESMPIIKRVGSKVYAGTINNEGFLEIKVTKTSGETLLSKIVRLVKEAQRKKAPIERFIDKFSKYYTPTVILLAVLVATIPPFMFNLSFNQWLYKALILLVVSCPCALAISTPVAMVSAITSAARDGVLIKGGNYIEEISKAKVFAFDKTGTLTQGNLEVTDIIPLGGTEKTVLAIAASLESSSEHPIAKAIVEKSKEKKVKLTSINNFKATIGKGVTGEINGEKYCLGNAKMFEECSVALPEKWIRKLENEGKTVIMIGNEKGVIGLIAVMDKIRNPVARTVAELKRKGIKTVMITGDNKRTAKAVAKQTGVNEFYAELLPEDKVKVIKELSRKYRHVVMVGDGINDAPALATANVGIAMGVIGSDVALETADIALMQDDVSKLPYLTELSKKTLAIIKENMIAAILIKGSFAVLAFPGFITLWLAVAIGDMGLSLAVIFNAMRLSSIKSKSKLLKTSKANVKCYKQMHIVE